jgi:hypothetical protein
VTAYSPLGSPHTAGFFKRRDDVPILMQVGRQCLYMCCFAVEGIGLSCRQLWPTALLGGNGPARGISCKAVSAVLQCARCHVLL